MGGGGSGSALGWWGEVMAEGGRKGIGGTGPPMPPPAVEDDWRLTAVMAEGLGRRIAAVGWGRGGGGGGFCRDEEGGGGGPEVGGRC